MRRAGHDVRAADDPEWEGWDDPDLLQLAASEGRVLITSNAVDFVPLAQEWHDIGRNHAGIILLPNSVRHEQFKKIFNRVSAKLSGTDQADWIDRTEWA